VEDEGQCQHPSTWRTGADNYAWHYEPALPLECIRSHDDADTPASCAAWLAEEERLRDADGLAPGYYERLAAWWLAEPAREPITVSRCPDGYYWVWGGYHRHALAVVHGLAAVPALVGIPKG
jgi:hypothetical protein